MSDPPAAFDEIGHSLYEIGHFCGEWVILAGKRPNLSCHSGTDFLLG